MVRMRHLLDDSASYEGGRDAEAVDGYSEDVRPPQADGQIRRVPAAPQLASASGTVLVVEADARLREHLCNCLPIELSVRSFGSLAQADGASILAGRPAVLVLGPSQATEAGLAQVGAALEATPGTGAVLILDSASVELMRLALRAGVHDALSLASADEHLAGVVADLLARLEDELEATGGQSGRAPSAGTNKGFVTTVFSPKGGVGKSVVAVNLAAGLVQRTAGPVVVVDLDLQFGDVAVMLRLQPRHTFSDAVSAELLDQELLRSFLARHEASGVFVLAAPTSPSEADLVEAASLLRVLDLLQAMFPYVVIDTPPQLSELVLQAVTHSGAVVFVVGLDVPAAKSAHLGLQAFDLLGVQREKLVVALNRAGSHVHLTARDIEKALGITLDIGLPSELAVPQSVNEGQPALLAYPRSRFAAQALALADLVTSKAEQLTQRAQRGR